MANVAGYLMTLRQSKRLSRAKLAERVGTTEMSILRIETQGQEPSGSLLVRLIDALGGSWDIVTRLIADDQEDALERVLSEAEQVSGPIQTDDRFDRFLELVASGMAPEDAARAVLPRQ